MRPLENTEDEYEVISGHRRLHIAVKAGLETVPAFIFAVNRDEAAIMLVDGITLFKQNYTGSLENILMTVRQRCLLVFGKVRPKGTNRVKCA